MVTGLVDFSRVDDLLNDGEFDLLFARAVAAEIFSGGIVLG